MLTKNQTWALVVVVLALWVVVSLAQGESRPTHLLTSLSYVVSGTWFALVLWERWLWRCGRPIEVYLVIRQTFSSLDVRMFSLESESISLSANLVLVAPELQTLFI